MRGKRSPDPTLHSDSDLLQHKGPLEAIQNGAPSPLNVMQIMRLSAGLIYQYRASIPKNFRTKLDKAVRANLDHAMFFMALDEGQRLTLERLRDGDLIGQETFARMSAEFELARRHYVRVAAYKVVGLMNEIEAFIARSGKGPGRPLGRKSTLAQDFGLLAEAANSPNLGQDDPACWVSEIREVIKRAIDRGELRQRGETPKDSIDIHSKRVSRMMRPKPKA
jgi:hypothetical protein